MTPVTSPPYYATRDWGAGQIGQEDTPAAYLNALRAVFREVHRVLRADGTRSPEEERIQAPQ
ncbi:DNA methyltransferase [Streptomyces violascens]|uniref:DNA methyltransferase n=1 Tax=Streptomyces violascens TaxID=67381 RepID=UPI00368DFC22